MNINLLGICGSPIINGNAEVFLKEGLKFAEEDGAKTELIRLAKRNIKDCIHCNWCISKQTEDKPCSIEDDFIDIYKHVLEADGILLSTPVYLTRLSGYLATLLDRFRVFVHGNLYKDALRNKVGCSLAVVWFRYGGIETTLQTLTNTFLILNMIPVGGGMASFHGGAGVSSFDGKGGFDPKDKHGVLKDEFGLKTVETTVKRMVEVIKILKAGKEALKNG